VKLETTGAPGSRRLLALTWVQETVTQLNIKPADKIIKDYYTVLNQYGQLHIDHEMAVRSAFQAVLRGYSKRLDWTLVPEYSIAKTKDRAHRVIVDGALLDYWKQRRGFWEAKDERDDLEREIKSKIDKGSPTSNIIFQAPLSARRSPGSERRHHRPEEPCRTPQGLLRVPRARPRGMGLSRRRIQGAHPRNRRACQGPDRQREEIESQLPRELRRVLRTMPPGDQSQPVGRSRRKDAHPATSSANSPASHSWVPTATSPPHSSQTKA